MAHNSIEETYILSFSGEAWQKETFWKNLEKFG
jgi:hypothetical protein